ncbi:hypothetical protein [Flavobacterium sp.]|uniref:hypothetical protein n=1 Tax=Flavobacterium sp. TaxID=239 RepID=UPI00286D1153|nr:hypothetical protein [Flavobacterium sp.]
MKKLYSLIVLVLICSFSAKAQSEKVQKTPELAAEEDLLILSRSTDINDEKLLKNLYDLFLSKQTELSKANVSAEKKQAMVSKIENTVNTNFSKEIISQLKSDGLYDRLLNDYNYKN